jgi:hypothetical protein
VSEEPRGAALDPLDILRRGVASFRPWLRASGELVDPVFGEPTQYATPYHALANAVLAAQASGPERQLLCDRAAAGLDAALDDLLDLDRRPTLSGFDRRTGAVHRSNHRDFYWPPVLKTYRLLRELGVASMEKARSRIADVDIERAFSSRPPSNWAAVWISGEWLRMKEKLTPHSERTIDGWLAPFFERRILLDKGMYQEPGHPNSYDLFTRWHLLDLLNEEYRGRWRPELEELMGTGLRRSLALQLSDGSLASAHRSTGQTWTVGAQCAYFALTARRLERVDRELSELARDAAWRALASLARWQRSDDVFSPVENRLPPGWRVGYERYTADAHYGTLALAFLAMAARAGFDRPPPARPPDRAPDVFIEADPTWRAIAHNGAISVHVNGRPHPDYDAFGIVDVTFGPGRYLHFVSSARYAGGDRLLNPGVEKPSEMALTGPIERDDSASGLVMHARALGAPDVHRLQVTVDRAEVGIEESTPGHRSAKTLLVPYLRDPGGGTTTRVDVSPGEVRFHHGAEVVAVGFGGEPDHVVDLPYGYESRRGLCGLVRIEFREPRDTLRYSLSIVE